jgi:hypothetical protein
MGLILLLVVLVLLFGGGGFYLGAPYHYFGGGPRHDIGDRYYSPSAEGLTGRAASRSSSVCPQ